MKKYKDENVRHFLYDHGFYEPVDRFDPRISYWNVDAQEYNHHISILSGKLYKKDFHLHDSYRKKYKDKKEIRKRGAIKKYSFKADKRCKFYLKNVAHLMEVFVSLTYPMEYPMDGELVKKQLHRFIGWLGGKYKYFWILEFQDRGAPHFHFTLDKPIPHQDVAKAWYRIVASGDEKHLKAGTEVRAIRSKGSIAHYMTKYMDKSEQKIVPPEYQKVGRFWGHSKGLLQSDDFKIYAEREEMHKVKKQFRLIKRFDKAQKRQWDKKDKERGKPKNKFKKYRNANAKRTPYSLRVPNMDKLHDALIKNDIEFLPDYLLSLAPPPTPQATTSVVPRSGGGKVKLPFKETLDEFLKRKGL